MSAITSIGVSGFIGLVAAVAATALVALGTVVKPTEAPYPGLADDAVEHQTATVTISDSSTTGTVTITFEAGFTSAPTVGVGKRISSKSGSSSTTGITSDEITSVSASSVDVEVTLDTAPGSGESTTVEVGATAMGD
jgi:hypothetical protein